MHRRRLLPLAGTAVAVSGTAGCLSAGGSGTTRRVSMPGDFEYDPDRLRVDAGATVRWTNEGRARVTSRPGQNGQVNAVLIED